MNTIDCAILELEAARELRYLGKWTAAEMRELKRDCGSKDAPAFAPVLYRAMVAENNGWSYKAGAADVNQVDQFAREWEEHQNR